MVTSKPAVFLFAGSDNYSKEQAIKKLSATLLDASSRELDYKVFDGAGVSARDIIDHLSTIPFLASKRLTVIRNFEKLPAEDSERLAGYLKVPLKSACLVLDSQDDSFTKEYPDLSRHVLVSWFGPVLNDHQFELRAKDILSAAGCKKDISADAARTLKELCRDDMGSVAQELQKLSSFVGERGRIEARDVEEITGRNLTTSAFDLTDAIEKNDLKGALSIISDLILSGKKHYEIVGLLCWQTKRLFRGRVLLERKIPDPQIANTLKIGKRYQERFFRQIRAFGLAQIESKMKVLLEADLGIKRTKYDPEFALEFAIIKLCLGLS
ncbi:MAG: DNA polymerase III subunit delta [Candidatus Omnitrophica bacterium]|nr:DNA polymerase III subunit delta [Candidatus Omnitrophota bacterium]